VTDIREKIRIVQDFPKPGIGFFDITTMLKDGTAFRQAINNLYERYRDTGIDKIGGIEARGFVFAAVLAYKMRKGLVLIRKPGKLPAETLRKEYALEYGSDAVEMHTDAVEKGEKILMIDDLLATGGTVGAACSLIEQAGGTIAGVGFLIELDFLKGREKLKKYGVYSMIHIEKE
jgi:adenine phosphoribosyltransferase